MISVSEPRRPVGTEFLTSSLTRNGIANLLTSQSAVPGHSGPPDPESGWVMYSDGEMSWTWSPAARVPETVWLVARGTPVLGVWPVLEVEANGGPGQLLYVRGSSWQALPVHLDHGELSLLTIRFVNDGSFVELSTAGESGRLLEDRNVSILGLWTPDAAAAP
jgi:hypothetical protein